MITTYEGRPGEGMQLHRNRAQWLAIGDFLARQNLRLVLARRRSVEQGAAGGASATSAAPCASHFIPVGNHGEIVAMGEGV